MSDPTLQKSGPMIAFGIGRFFLDAQYWTEVQSFPTESPPPAWTEGRQWQNLTFWPLPLPSGKQMLPYEALGITKVVDRSAQAVPPGKGYAFTTNIDYEWKPYFELRGVPEGSTCLPGVVLYNLVTHPNVWTLVRPNSFDGAWSISWLSPRYVTPVTVSVGYAPAQDGFPTSRLWWAFSAAYWWDPPPQETVPSAGSIEIVSSSPDYAADEWGPVAGAAGG